MSSGLASTVFIRHVPIFASAGFSAEFSKSYVLADDSIRGIAEPDSNWPST